MTQEAPAEPIRYSLLALDEKEFPSDIRLMFLIEQCLQKIPISKAQTVNVLGYLHSRAVADMNTGGSAQSQSTGTKP